jgi:hypothetical protein
VGALIVSEALDNIGYMAAFTQAYAKSMKRRGRK